MPQVIRAPLAEADLDWTWLHIARDNPPAADRLIDRITNVCGMLAANPELGERRPELARGLRSFVVGNYVIYYRPMQDGIEVARVLHGARDVGSIF
jgi:toxin ParE1/3/4